MAKSLYEMVVAFYTAAARAPEAQTFLLGKGDRLYLDRVYQFEIIGAQLLHFYIQIKKGKLSIHRGVTTKSSWWDRVDIQTTEETLRGVLRGQIKLVDAIDNGLWKSTSNEHWRGSHIPVLTRIGQDIASRKL